MSGSTPDPAAPAAVFVYGTLRSGGRGSGLLRGERRLREAVVRGTLFSVEGRFPALVLDGAGEVHGEIWSCARGRLPDLDRYEGVQEGLYHREALDVDGTACWVYVAGPALRPSLKPQNRVPDGRWPAP